MKTGTEVRNHRDLLVWQRGMEIVSLAYAFSRTFPRDERYGLTLQLRRAAVSIPSNLAEGHARRSTRDFVRFVSYAAGSAAELETQVLAAVNLNYGSDTSATILCERIVELQKMLHGLRRSLKSRMNGKGATLR